MKDIQTYINEHLGEEKLVLEYNVNDDETGLHSLECAGFHLSFGEEKGAPSHRYLTVRDTKNKEVIMVVDNGSDCYPFDIEFGRALLKVKGRDRINLTMLIQWLYMDKWVERLFENWKAELNAWAERQEAIRMYRQSIGK